jgi:hypothetical protein
MSQVSGLPYTVASGDTNDSILKRFSIQKWDEVYYHPNNTKLRDKFAEADQIKAGEIVWVPASHILPTKTGTSEAVQQPIWRFFFNAHMHIQSNNCCPMPLQWGLLTKNIIGFPIVNWFVKERMRGSRKSTDEMSRWGIMTLLLGRLGKIGSLSTDLIAGVYMSDLKDTDMDAEMVWLVMDDEKFQKLDAGKKTETLLSAGKKLQLQQMSADTDKMFRESFLEPTRYYYPGGDPTMFNVALLMDMSLAHYWGRWHIPVMISRKTEALYINDWCKAYVPDEINKNKKSQQQIKGRVIEPKAKSGNYMHLYAKATRDTDFSLEKAIENYIVSKGDPGQPQPGNAMAMVFPNPEEQLALCKGKYAHLVDQIPGGAAVLEDGTPIPNEIKWFEDYDLQMSLSEGAAVKYPLKFFLFYHYDPRRHCQGSAEARANIMAGEIVSNHAFFRCDQLDKPEKNKPAIIKTDKEMNTCEFWEDTLNKTLKSNTTAFNFLHHLKPSDGIYWGVKIYPRLGYDPSDFVNYPQLRELYQQCQNGVPLLAHGSRGPMGGADYYCYAKYDRVPGLTGNDKIRYDALTADPSNLDHTEYWFADIFAAPGNWEQVLLQYPELRLCLAHFGGYDTWCQVGDFKEIEKKYPQSPGLFPRGEKLEGSDEDREKMRATLYHAWIRKIAELANAKSNVYTDLSYFDLAKDLDAYPIRLKGVQMDSGLLAPERLTALGEPDTMWIEVDCKKLIAKNLVYLLKKFSNLKDKIIIGTDWYMIEKEQQKGVGEILRNLFIVMDIVSEEVGYDAWHQFAVVNPLKYLGMGQEEDRKILIESRKLEMYGDLLLAKLKDKEWKEKSRIKTKESDVQDTINKMQKNISQFPSVPLETDLKVEKNQVSANSMA